MYWQLPKYFFIVCFCALIFSNSVFAAPTKSTWTAWFVDQINQHPDAVAARETMNAALSMAQSHERPLYNPQLETEIERVGSDDIYRIGISQTIDWWDKRGMRQQQADFARIAAQQDYQLVLQQKYVQALQTLVDWQAAQQQAQLAHEQETHLDTLFNLVKKRQQAGELGLVDAELAFLSFAQRLNATAQSIVQFKKAEARLHELLPNWSSERAQIPESIWTAINTTPLNLWIDNHPSVMAARAKWEMLQKAAELAQRETQADPTFGINAGKEGNEDALALTLSIPLNVRNDFSAQARSAGQEALSAQAHYHAIRRKTEIAIEVAQTVLHEYQRRVERWQILMQGRDQNSGDLLETQWRSGEMSTTEYLLALQQRADGLMAGIDLRTQYQLARIDWLLQTGQIITALMPLNR